MALLNVKGNEIVLNTPNRKEILNGGPPQETKSNFLGKGSFGTVFKAIYKGKEVAVKVVKSDRHCDCLANEANVLGWRHKHIVKVLQIESTPKFGIIIMERSTGHCLQKILDSNVNIPLKHKILISLDIVSALTYCHKRNVLHLDVKPQNILIVMKKSKTLSSQRKECKSLYERNYICKLCDFGGSQKWQDDKENPSAGKTKGTIRYMAPEVLKEHPLTPAADIYSLGITMWQLKAKQIPYHWLDSNEIVAYLVVKNNLRPDSKEANFRTGASLSFKNGRIHENCYCTSLLDNYVYKSIEDIKYLLHSCDGKGAKDFPKITLARSNPNLVKLSSCSLVRQLKFNEDLIVEGPALLNKEESSRKSSDSGMACFVKLFQSPESGSESHLKKTLYDGIYKSCWSKDFTLRPSSSELQSRLKSLL